jgi:hypothetical protein
MELGLFDAFLDRNMQIGLATAIVVGVAVGFVTRRLRRRKSPEELERRRRQLVSESGRVADGIVLELHGNTVFYTYKVRGIEYDAAQEISQIRHLLPAEEHRLIGAVNLKYIPENPANSIVIAEEWCGLRVMPPVSSVDQKPQPVE